MKSIRLAHSRLWPKMKMFQRFTSPHWELNWNNLFNYCNFSGFFRNKANVLYFRIFDSAIFLEGSVNNKNKFSRPFNAHIQLNDKYDFIPPVLMLVVLRENYLVWTDGHEPVDRGHSDLWLLECEDLATEDFLRRRPCEGKGNFQKRNRKCYWKKMDTIIWLCKLRQFRHKY